MRSPVRPLLLLHRDAAFQARLRQAAAREFSVVPLPSWAALNAELKHAPVAALAVVDPYHATPPAAGLAPELKELLRGFPLLSVLVVLEVRAGGGSDLRQLGAWGVADVVGPGDRAEALAQMLRSLRGQPLQVLLARALGERLSGRARSIVNVAADVAATGGQGKALAGALHASPRTLLRWCTQTGLPPPRQLLAWMRLLLAAELLGHPGRSVEEVASACGYASDSGLRRAFQDFLGTSPRSARGGEVFATVVRAFTRELEGLPQPEPRAERGPNPDHHRPAARPPPPQPPPAHPVR